MKSKREQIGWEFWIWWTGLTTIGGMAGTYLADQISSRALALPTDAGILFSMLESGVFALVVSGAQWILLRRLFSGTAWWLVAGTLGRALGMLLGSIAIVLIGHQFNLQVGLWSSSIYLAVRGAVLGASQLLILKRWRTRAGWWVLGNAVAWMLGPTLMDWLIPANTLAATRLGDLIAAAIAGAMTGAVLVWILRQPTPAPLKDTRQSRWIVAWMTVWAVSWGVSWVVGWSVVRAIVDSGYIIVGGKIGGMIAGGVAGLIGGIGTAIVLKRALPSIALRTYHLILVAVGWVAIMYYDWMDGFVIAGLPVAENKYGIVTAPLAGAPIKYWMAGPMSGLMGGVLMALILSWAVRALNVKQLLVIALGWAVGFAIAGWTVWTIGLQIASNYVTGPTYGNAAGASSLILLTLISVLGGAFAGWMGAAATLGQFESKLAAQTLVRER